MLLSLSARETYADESTLKKPAKDLITQISKNIPADDLTESDESKVWSAELSLGAALLRQAYSPDKVSILYFTLDVICFNCFF